MVKLKLIGSLRDPDTRTPQTSEIVGVDRGLEQALMKTLWYDSCVKYSDAAVRGCYPSVVVDDVVTSFLGGDVFLMGMR